VNPPPEELPRCADCGKDVELLTGETRVRDAQIVIVCEDCAAQQSLTFGEAA
jgi:DNA-directed RNA polymerase subunit RPC12/RpoP